MAKPKFDYNGDAFYDEIEQLAKQGQKDSEIAYALGFQPNEKRKIRELE